MDRPMKLVTGLSVQQGGVPAFGRAVAAE